MAEVSAHSSSSMPSSSCLFVLPSRPPVLCHRQSREIPSPASAFFPAVCKYVAVELKSAFEETSKTKEVIDTKYGFLDGKGSAVKYTQS